MCTLRWPSDEDFRLVERWLRPMSLTSALTGDMNEDVAAEQLRAAHTSGAVRYLMVVANGDEAAGGETVGVVNYRRIGSAGSFSIGGAIGEPGKWSQGRGGEALTMLVDHLFHQLNAHRVEFTTAAYNRHTMSMLAKGGFVLEGILRDYYFLDGMYHDRTIWSILRQEFLIGAKTYAKTFPITDLVPDSDKQQARTAFAKYLASDPPTSLRDFEERASRVRPY